MTIKPRNCLSNIICIQLKNQMTQNERQKGREKERDSKQNRSVVFDRLLSIYYLLD